MGSRPGPLWNMSPVPFPQLQAFLAVARHQSFSGAARELGVSRSAVSQSVRQLEELVRVVLLARTTRSVSLTDAGRRLVDGAGPSLAQVAAALAEVSAKPGETVGRLKLTVPRAAVPFVIDPVVPTFRARHPRIEVEIIVEERFVDIVAEGYDAGVRLSEAIERDMVQVRLTDSFRFVIVGAPKYLEQRGIPERPEDLLRHECITFRNRTSGARYAWELERGRRNWRVPVRGGVVCSDSASSTSLAEKGVGLAYALEPMVREQLRDGRLKLVLERYAATVPGFFLYFPSVARKSPPLRSFVEAARELAVRTLSD
jgi:DNA-binding transcriptional LysR family regulator